MGRRPKTEAQRLVDGSKSRPYHEPQPVPILGEPVKPEHLSLVAAAKWDELVAILRGEQRLHVSDGGQLENAAQLYASARRWQGWADKAKSITKAEKPLKQARMAWDAYRKAEAELGITQTSRSRAKGGSKDGGKKEPTPLEKLRAARAAQRVLRAV
jgi:hypothetical protein